MIYVLYFLSVIGAITLLILAALLFKSNRDVYRERLLEAHKARYPDWATWYAPLRNRFRVWLVDKILGKGWRLMQQMWIQQARIGYEKKTMKRPSYLNNE